MKRLLIVLSIILTLIIGHIVGYMTRYNFTVADFREDSKNKIIREVPEGYPDSEALHRFERIIVDGDSDTVQELYQRVADEAQNLPDIFIDIFNTTGFKLIITDKLSRYTRQ